MSVIKAALLIGTNKSSLTAPENGRINLSGDWIDKILKAYRFNKEVFNGIKKGRPSSKDEIVKEIAELASMLSYEKLMTIRQLLGSF